MNVRVAPRLFRFGVFEADLENARLTRKGVRIRLQEQPFTILAMLLERSGQIVTRDELRQKLWPEGTYVGFDGSLNAALNRLRSALDDDADNPRFIETIPKRGYRFIAPVKVDESAGPVTSELKPPLVPLPPDSTATNGPAPDSRAPGFIFSTRRVLAAGVAALVFGLGAFVLLHKRGTPSLVSAESKAIDIGSLRRSVAVLGFQNASGRPSDAWLSTALSEMLRTELGAGGKLRVVPGENVAQFRAGAPWSQTDSLSRQTSSVVGKALDSDLLVLGSFAALGDPQSGSVRVDFRLQDAQTGEILYEGAEAGSEKQFFGLVATIGTDLRQRLGLPMISESEEAGVISSLPSDPEANRFYSLGLQKLREEDVAAAKDLFLQAEQIAPNFPLVHLMLGRAWGSLGYDQRSAAEVKKAFDLSGNLPETDRLLIQAAFYDSLHDKDKAAAAYRALFSVYPDSVDYGLRLFDVLNNAGRHEEALAVIRQLRALPAPASDNPRIDFAQAITQTNGQDAQPFLDRAIAKATSQGQTHLYARFRLQQCIDQVYGPHPQGGVAHCQEAYDVFMAAGNRLLAADALRTMGDRRGSKGDYEGARELYTRALSILLPMGEHEKTGVVLNNMAITYENQGQIDQSEKLFRQAATTWTECGDLLHAAVAFGNLADISMMRGELRQAEKQYDQARKQIELSDPHDGFAYELYNIGNIRLYEGDMTGARNFTAQALSMARDLKNTGDVANASEVMGAIHIAADELPAARDSFQQAVTILQQKDNQGGVAEGEAALAEVLLEEGKFVEAERALRKSLAEFRAENTVMDEIRTQTDLSRALLHQQKFADARQAISDAMALTAASRDPSLKLPAAIMDARVEAAEISSRTKSPPNFSKPRRKLLKVLSTAHQLGYYGVECDARLALDELEARENSPSANKHLMQLAGEARAHGLNLVSRKAATLADSISALAEKPRAH